jgi:hypothetical protein
MTREYFLRSEADGLPKLGFRGVNRPFERKDHS